MKLKQKSTIKGLMIILMTMLCMVCSTAVSAFAAKDSKTDPQGALQEYIYLGGGTVSETEDANGNKVQSVQGGVRNKTYIAEGGGSYKYSELVDKNGLVIDGTFNKLKSSEKNKLLSDMYDLSNTLMDKDTNITEGTQDNWLKSLQNCNGVGSQLINTILKNTKPDYATANRIYAPFSGIVGTILGLGSILIMAFLGITMVLDLSYIGIPAFRLMLDGGDEGGKGGGKPKVISYEAVTAVQTAEGGQGGGGQNGSSNKVAVGIYFKKRVIMLIALGICLLYLIQGQIFTLVSWILDLVSGFFGF